MPFRNNYWKSIIGNHAQVLMSLGVAYTSQSTYELFVANSAEGEMGVFNNDTHALISGGGAVANNINLFIAVNRGGTKGPWSNTPQVPNVIEKSPIFQTQQAVINRQAYDAPIAQVSQVILASHGRVTVQDVTFVAKAAGASSPVTINYVVAGANTAFSVAVVGNAITVNMATNGSSASTTTAAQVVAGINGSAPALALVNAFVSGNAATVEVTSGGAQAMTGSTAATTITSGQIYALAILETTIGFQPFPTYVYQSVGGATSGGVLLNSEDTIMADLAAQINSTTSIANRDRDIIASATYSGGVLTVTALYFGSTFNLFFPGLQFPALASDNNLGNIAVISTLVKAHAGSGSADQARLFQFAGDEYKGITTQYPLQGSRPEDYGQPDDFVALNAVKTFDIISFNITTVEGSRTFLHKQSWGQNLFVLLPSSGTSPLTQIRNIFGV